jgi:hypothetical protein
MVLSLWNDPAAFTRAWFILEVFLTAEAGNKFEIAMGESDRIQFLKDSRAEAFDIP